MKETKKKGLYKVLLTVTATMLVAAISVGLTLAYLTAQTSPVTNTFTSAGSITGAVHEPKWDAGGKTEAENFSLGNPIDKDPLVQNTTTAIDIYAGVRLDFYIYKESAAGVLEADPTQVSYDVFKKFVDIAYDSSHEFNTSAWTELTASTGTNSKYFIYNTILKAHKDDDATSSISSTYTSNKADCSSPLFQTVTAKSAINMGTLASGTGYSTSYDDGPSGTYNKFKFEIKITGYGVKAFVSGTQADGLSFDNAKIAILKQLGGSTTDVTTAD